MVMVVTLGMNQAVGELVQAVAEGVVVTVLVVVTHLGFLGCGLVAGSVDSFLGDLDVLAVLRARGRGVNGEFVDTDVLLEGGTLSRGVDGELVNTNGLLEEGALAGSVNGGTGHAELVLVGRLDTGAIFTLGNVNGSVVGTMSLIDLNAGIGVGGARSAVMLFAIELLVAAGTAVTILFTSDADLFFAEASLSARR
jgi:predicted aconitase with swiveling domain